MLGAIDTSVTVFSARAENPVQGQYFIDKALRNLSRDLENIKSPQIDERFGAIEKALEGMEGTYPEAQMETTKTALENIKTRRDELCSFSEKVQELVAVLPQQIGAGAERPR